MMPTDMPRTRSAALAGGHEGEQHRSPRPAARGRARCADCRRRRGGAAAPIAAACHGASSSARQAEEGRRASGPARPIALSRRPPLSRPRAWRLGAPAGAPPRRRVAGSAGSTVPSMFRRGSTRSSQLGQRPRARADQVQDRGQQQAAHDERIEEHGAREAQAELLDHAVFAEHEREEHAHHDRGGGGHDATGQREPFGDRARACRACAPSARGCARRGTPRSPSTARTRSRTASPG